MPFPALSRFVETLPAQGTFSLWWGPLDGEAWFTHNEHTRHYAASTMKVGLVLAAYREADQGTFDLDRPVTVHNDFVSAAGSGRYGIEHTDDSDPEPWRWLGTEVALRCLCQRALVRSSNLATNLVLEQVGVEAVAEALAAVGACASVVTRGIEDSVAREAGYDNLVTAADLALTLQALASGQAASTASCREIVAVLAAQQINDALPAQLPPGIRVAHKSGWVNGISHDAGIVYPDGEDPFVFVMCTTSNLDEQAGCALIAAGAAAAYADRRVQP
jgi:beta-lactamase class A